MKQVIFDSVSGSPDTEEWHIWRAGGLGGSDATQIAAGAQLITPPAWANPAGVISNKLGLYEVETNAAMQRGKDHEEAVRAKACAALGIEFLPAFGEMEDDPFIRASFDGISFDDEILEIKVPSPKVHDLAKQGEVVEYYRPQLAHQLMVLHGNPDAWRGDEVVNFVSAVPETGDLAIVRKRSGEFRTLATRLLEAERSVWKRVQLLRSDPGTQAVREILADESLIADWREVARIERRLESAKKVIREHVLDGGSTTLNVRVSRRTKNLADYEALCVSEEVKRRHQRTSWCVSLEIEVEEIASVAEAERVYAQASLARKAVSRATLARIEAAKVTLTAYCKAHALPVRANGVRVYPRMSTDWKALCEAEGLRPETKATEYTVVEFK